MKSIRLSRVWASALLLLALLLVPLSAVSAAAQVEHGTYSFQEATGCGRPVAYTTTSDFTSVVQDNGKVSFYKEEGSVTLVPDPPNTDYPTYTGHYSYIFSFINTPGGTSVGVVTIAVNLFGSDGSHPVLTWTVRFVANSTGTHVDRENFNCRAL